MMPVQKYWLFRTVLQLWLLYAMTLPLSAAAEMLDSIDIERADGMAVIKITLSHNIRYRGHFPQDRGNILNIYFDNVSLEDNNIPNPNQNPMMPGAPKSSAGSHDMPDEYMRSIISTTFKPSSALVVIDDLPFNTATKFSIT